MTRGSMMSKRGALWFLCALCVEFTSGALDAQPLERSVSRDELRRVALLELRGGALSAQERRYMSELLRGTLAEALGLGYQLLSRENFHSLIPAERRERLEAGEMDSEVELARLLRARWLISGEVARLGPLLTLRLKVHESETGRFLGLRELAAPTLLRLRERAPRLTWRLAELIDPSRDWGDPPSTPPSAPLSTPPRSPARLSRALPSQPQGLIDGSLDSDSHPLTPRREAHPTTDALSLTWREVPSGEVTLGDLLGEPDERPLKRVSVPRFWVSVTEVTEGQYQTCVRAGVCAPLTPCEGLSASQPQRPARCVTWPEASLFARWAGAQLPSEAEWARVAQLSYGERPPLTPEALKGVAWFGAHTLKDAQPVALKKASALGVHDLLGNVWEWTRDRYAPYDAPASNRPSPSEERSWPRVARGGGWRSERLESLRLSNRLSLTPHTRLSDVGFRLTRATDPTLPLPHTSSSSSPSPSSTSPSSPSPSSPPSLKEP